MKPFRITLVIEYDSEDSVPRFSSQMTAAGGIVKAVQFSDALTESPTPDAEPLRGALNALLAYARRGSPEEKIIAHALNLKPEQLNPPPASHELE